MPAPTSWRQTAIQCLIFPVVYWNWKAAVITAVMRGSAFLLAAGQQGGSKGALVEVLYVILNSGFFSAIQQGLMGVRPRWAGNLGIVIAVPAFAQACDYWIHIVTASPNPPGFTLGMLLASWISAMLHLHIMERGAMLMGKDSRSFAADLRAIPVLLVSFVCLPVKWATAQIGSQAAAAEWEPGAAD